MAENLTELGDASKRLADARAHLMAWQPWYAHMAVQITWLPSNHTKTMGVRITEDVRIEGLFNPAFVLSTSVKALSVVVQHEIEHLIRLHCVRQRGRDPYTWNVACDMCVNGSRRAPRIGYEDRTTGTWVLPINGNIIWIPDRWPMNGSAEFYYHLITTSCAKSATSVNDGSGKERKSRSRKKKT